MNMKDALQNAVKRRFPALARFASLPTVVIGAATLVATSNASAAIALPDVGDVITAIAGVVVIASSIGIAALSVTVTVQLFRWIRGALR